MTEAKWLAATDPQPLVELLSARTHPSDRKFRLLLVECSRRDDHRLGAEAKALREVAERFADGTANEDERRDSWEVSQTLLREDGGWCLESAIVWALFEPHSHSYPLHDVLCWAGRCLMETETVTAGEFISLLRCIFGNPFRPVAFAPNWCSETAVALATGIYDERAFDRLPILADALEEAGCDHDDLLAHCRGPGPHARGCWVVDGVLGKK